jgi:threonine dehydratase
MASSPGSEPDIAAIRAAAGRIAGHAVMTPLLESPAVNARLGGRLLIKAEPLQRTGSFKFRGAFNALSQLDARDRRAGVVAWSSGNHAQGVAAAAQALGIPAAIVMPSDAPAIKLANTREYGAQIILYDRYAEDREAIGRRIAGDRGARIVAPYDEPWVIAGQGTCGLEIAAAAAARDIRLDAVLIPCGGGGLTAGCCIALAATSPATAVIAVEPEGFDDTGRSLAADERRGNPPGGASFCDALLAPMPGEITFAINRRHLAGALAVSDRETAAAMAFAFTAFKLVVESGGAVALAAILAGKYDIAGRSVAVVASGGNVDPTDFGAVLARPPAGR